MLNVETRKKLFEKGEFIKADNHEDYTVFTNSGVTEIVKPVTGFIYVNESNLNLNRNKLIEQLNALEQKYSDVLNKYKHLCDFLPIYSYANGFTVAKMKIIPEQFKKNTTITLGEVNLCKRAVLHEYELRIRQNSTTKNHIFTWIIYDSEKIERDISQEHVNITDMMFSIYYDYSDVLMFNDGERVMNYIGFKDLKIHKNASYLTIAGMISSPKICSHPAFIFRYKSIYGGELNLYMLNKLGREGPFYDDIRLWDIQRQANSIFKISFDKLEIDNSVFAERNKLQIKYNNDECVICLAPLCAQIYVIFPDKTQKKCYALCKFCAHGKFIKNKDGHFVRDMYEDDGKYPYLNTDTIAHTIYPKTLPEVYCGLLNKIKDLIEERKKNPKAKTEIKKEDFTINHFWTSYFQYIKLDKEIISKISAILEAMNNIKNIRAIIPTIRMLTTKEVKYLMWHNPHILQGTKTEKSCIAENNNPIFFVLDGPDVESGED
jgi:hypothetical protein